MRAVLRLEIKDFRGTPQKENFSKFLGFFSASKRPIEIDFSQKIMRTYVLMRITKDAADARRWCTGFERSKFRPRGRHLDLQNLVQSEEIWSAK